jgi:hypothetical protein
MVKASLTGSAENNISRPFTYTVEVEADDNRPGWRDAMSALLIRECLARW